MVDNASKFAELEREIRRIDIDADSIEVTYHLRKFAELFQRHVTDDQTLSDLFTYLNRIALGDGKFAINMAAIFASRQLDDLVIQETKLRNAMLLTLQHNFQAIDELKRENVSKFYNSVTLLGEYYHRKKFGDGKRILILGQSLLLLLTTELEKEIKKCEDGSGYTFDPEFAKVILSQVTLNGSGAAVEHRQEIEDLNYSIRKCLINVRDLASRAKAYLLMALDLFYMNFNLNSTLLEKLYGKYLFEPDEDTSAKQPEGGKKITKQESSSTPSTPTSNTGTNGTGSKPVSSKKSSDKTDSTKKQGNKVVTSAKPRKKEPAKSESTVSTPNGKPPTSPVKKTTQVVPPRRPPLNHSSPKKDQRPKTPISQKTPPHRNSTSEKLKPVTPPPPKNQTHSPKPNHRTPENHTVLKQNCKTPPKNSVSPAPNAPSISPGGHQPANLKLQISPANNHHHHHNNNSKDLDNVENLAWDELSLEDESPQKINPHTKSFLSFLAQK